MEYTPNDNQDPSRVIMDLYFRVVDLEHEVSILKKKMAIMENSIPGAKPKLSKRYMKLSEYLKNSQQDEIILSFKDIEDILGFDLTELQKRDVSSWANSDSHSLARSWLGVGYDVAKRDIDDNKDTSENFIMFKKRDTEK